MPNYEYFSFFCGCTNDSVVKTDENGKGTCARCGKKYEIEMLPHKFLIPKKEKDAKIK